MLRFALLPGVVVGVLAFAPVAAAGDVTFGSSLNDSATTVPYRNGWDQTVFNTAGPAGFVAEVWAVADAAQTSSDTPKIIDRIGKSPFTCST